MFGQYFYSDSNYQDNSTNFHNSGSQIYAGPVTNNTVISGLWDGTTITRVVNGAKTNWIGNWWQLVRTYSSTTLIPYTNGVALSSGTVSWVPPWSPGYTGGNSWYLNFAAAETTSYTGTTAGWYSGKFGIIRMYNRALSAAEILANYNNTKSVYGL